MSSERTWTNINDSWQMNFARLAWHCGVKGVQLGSVLGCVFVAPYTLYKGLKNKTGIEFRVLANRQVYAMGFGLLLSWGMMMGKYSGWENKERCLQDRTYRIHYNEGQQKVDSISYICFPAAFLTSYFLTRRIILSIGMTSPALVAGMIYYQASKLGNPPNKE